MKRLFTLSMLTVLLASVAVAQPFTQLNAGFLNLGESTARFVDYDADGDLDVFIGGEDNQGSVNTMIYQNDNGNYTPLSLGLLPFAEGDLKFGDFDMDNDLDFFMYGVTANDSMFFAMYENFDGMFMYKSTDIIALKNGRSAWGDYDADGDLDLAVTGNWEAKIYTNNDGDFMDSGFDFGAFNSSCAVWGDYDNDGDLDLLLNGDSGAGAHTKLIRNDDGDFIDSGIELPGLMAGEIEFVDFDTDGDLDISLTGFDDALVPKFHVMRNMGDDVFEEAYLGLADVAVSAVDWADFDADGDMDLAAIGNGAGCGLFIGKIYRNEGTYYNSAADISAMTRGSLQWGDYDNDGDLDLLASGLVNDQSPKTTIYVNEAGSNQFASNSLPEAPAGLSTEASGHKVTFSWEAATDNESPQSSLSYNLRVSTVSNSCDVLAPMSDEMTGYRRIVEAGNAGNKLSYTLHNLPEGMYYWSVQSIDQAFAGSEFAEEQTFTISITGIRDEAEEGGSILFNPLTEVLTLEGIQVENAILSIYDLSGKLVKRLEGQSQMNLSELQGFYIVRLTSPEKNLTRKIIIK